MEKVNKAVRQGIVFFLFLYSFPANSYKIVENNFVSDDIRNSSVPIEVSVLVPQEGMLIQYVPELNVGPVVNEGLIGNLIRGVLDKEEKKKSIRKGHDFDQAMDGIDIPHLALSVTQDAFSNIQWLGVRGSQGSHAPIQNDDASRATMVFEYAIDPNFTRIFVGCSLHINKSKSLDEENKKRSKGRPEFLGINQSQIEIVGLSSEKRERMSYFLAQKGARIHSYLTDSFADCARLAARGAEFRRNDLEDLMSQKTTTISTRTNVQWQGWLVEGGENLVDGKFGTLGIKKTFTQTRSAGTVIWGGSPVGLIRLRAVDPD